MPRPGNTTVKKKIALPKKINKIATNAGDFQANYP